jgi:hypothetical protein
VEKEEEGGWKEVEGSRKVVQGIEGTVVGIGTRYRRGQKKGGKR